MDPTLRIKTIALLKERIVGLSPQMRMAAKYVIDHPADFGMDPIRDTARKAGVSTYTFVNMAKALGFSGFGDFRDPFRHALVSGAPLRPVAGLEGIGAERAPQAELFRNAAQNGMSIVSRSLDQQNIEDMDALATLLFGARNVYVTAVRSSYAIAYYLHYVGRMALPTLQLIPRHQNSAIDDLSDAGAGDVLIAITVTPYSRETIDACAFARKKGLKLVFITDSEIVSPELDPEFTLATSVLSTHNFGCFSGMMSVVEVLLAFLMQRGGRAAQSRIKSYEDVRIQNNAYWVAQKKH